MRLALSSAAAPAATLEDLVVAAVRRGLDAVELVEGQGHGVEPGADRLATAVEAAARAHDRGISIVGYRLARPDGPWAGSPRDLAGLSRALDAPVLVPCVRSGRVAVDRAEDLAAGIEAGSGQAVVLLPSGPAAAGVLERLPAERTAAWEADPSVEDLRGTGVALLEALGPRLRHVLLRGGGPEAAQQAGRGIGSIMTRLAVSGFDGTVALAPSSVRYRVIWDAWLGRRGGWGCGSKSADPSLVTLGVSD